jgi:hypothetical protein
MDIYTMCNGHGEAMQTFDIAGALGRFGVTRQIDGADGIHSAGRRRGRCRDAADRLGRLGVVGAGRFVGIYPIRDRIGVIGHERIGGSGARLAELFADYKGVARAPFEAMPTRACRSPCGPTRRGDANAPRARRRRAAASPR